MQSIQLDSTKWLCENEELISSSTLFLHHNLSNIIIFGSRQDSIRELACDGQFTDVTIEVDNCRMRCHRMVLAASSKYFK